MGMVVAQVTELVMVEQERAWVQGLAKVPRWEGMCLEDKCLDSPDPDTTHHNIAVAPLERFHLDNLLGGTSQLDCLQCSVLNDPKKTHQCETDTHDDSHHPHCLGTTPDWRHKDSCRPPWH